MIVQRAPQRNHGGEGGIRTHGTLAGTPDFESGTIDHSATSPVQERGKVGRAGENGSRKFRSDTPTGMSVPRDTGIPAGGLLRHTDTNVCVTTD